MQEGEALLGGEELEKTRSQTASEKAANDSEAAAAPPKLPRDGTMAVTAKVRVKLLVLI